MGELLKSKVIELSESDSGNYFDITTRHCYFDDYNANGISLKSNEKLQDNINTLVATPVVAYYMYDWHKGDDFGGHEMYETYDGDYVFGTSAIGTHLSVWVENTKVKTFYGQEEKELPCLYSKSRIWSSRFPKYAKVIKRLYLEGKLGTSWELEPKNIQYVEESNKNIPNPRISDEYEFLGNCLLGSEFVPAYGDVSRVMEISSEEKSVLIELANALASDIENSLAKEKWGTGNMITIDKTVDSAVNTPWGDVNKTDLRNKALLSKNYKTVVKAIYQSIGEGWDESPSLKLKYPVMQFIENDSKLVYNINGIQSAVAYLMNTNTEEDKMALENLKKLYKKFDLNMDVFEPSKKEGSQSMLTIEQLQADMAEKDARIAELEKQVSENLEKQEKEEKLTISELQEKLVKASEQVAELNSKVEELTEIKTKYDEVIAEKEKAEKEEKIKELKALATKNGYVKEEELETSEVLKKAIEDCDEQAVKVFVAERIIESIGKNEKQNKKDETKDKREFSEKSEIKGNLVDVLLGKQI